jgi:hypothetical protein
MLDFLLKSSTLILRKTKMVQNLLLEVNNSLITLE